MIILNGASGQLGFALKSVLRSVDLSVGDGSVIALDRSQMDVTDRQSVRSVIDRHRPLVIINCAAYTAVDLAEEDPLSCRRANADAVEYLAQAANEVDALLVQVSTDYVFGGAVPSDGPNREDSPLLAQGVYAQTKLEGEINAAKSVQHLIVRTCGIYGFKPKPANFVESMIRLGGRRDELGVVDDQYCNPTSAIAVAQGIAALIAAQARGVFHVAASEPTTWCQFAREIFCQMGMSTKVNPITTEQFGAKAPRPRYSVLDTSKFTRMTGQVLPAIKDDLARYLDQRKSH